MSWMTNVQLLHLIKKYADEDCRRAFSGIFSIDELPAKVTQVPFLMIVNTHTKNLPGEHWKAVYISNEGFAEVFDSLASPVSTFLASWLNKHTRKWIPSEVTIQNPLAPTCGAFVLYFILLRLQHKNLKSLLKIFSSDLAVNDNKMLEFVQNLK